MIHVVQSRRKGKFARSAAGHLKELSRQFPSVTIVGPRQSGKTTLAQSVFPRYAYASLEDPDVRRHAVEDPRGFLASYPAPLIIDEVQRVPDILSYLQGAIDKTKKNGQYILTGSHQPRLKAEVSQSLAGRTALLKLLPPSFAELKKAGVRQSREEWVSRGFMPRLYDQDMDARLLYKSYFETYVQRDVQQLINVKDQSKFELFVRLLAGRVGQIANLQSLSGEIGVSAVTLNSWLSILEASYIVFRLPPYYRNLGKRLVKSPKLYFTEVGLAAYLLGIQNASQVAQHPLFGNLFENMVVADRLKRKLNAGQDPNLYYYRDARQMEVDLVEEDGSDLHAFEIKSSVTANEDFTDNLNALRKMSSAVRTMTVIYAGVPIKLMRGCAFANFEE